MRTRCKEWYFLRVFLSELQSNVFLIWHSFCARQRLPIHFWRGEHKMRVPAIMRTKLNVENIPFEPNLKIILSEFSLDLQDVCHTCKVRCTKPKQAEKITMVGSPRIGKNFLRWRYCLWQKSSDKLEWPRGSWRWMTSQIRSNHLIFLWFMFHVCFKAISVRNINLGETGLSVYHSIWMHRHGKQLQYSLN